MGIVLGWGPSGARGGRVLGGDLGSQDGPHEKVLVILKKLPGLHDRKQRRRIKKDASILN